MVFKIIRRIRLQRWLFEELRPFRGVCSGQNGMTDPALEEGVRRFGFRVRWSEREAEYVATVDEMRFLSWMDGDPVRALAGLRAVLYEVVAEKGGGWEEHDHDPPMITLRDDMGDTAAAVYSEIGVLMDRLTAMQRARLLVINEENAASAVTDAMEALWAARESLAWVDTDRSGGRADG